MYNLRDVMEMLKIPERTIRRHIKEGLLVGRKLGGIWKFTQEEVENYVRGARLQKHIRDEGLKDIQDYYRLNIEDKSEVVYMLIKDWSGISKIKSFLEVTKLFTCKFSMNCTNNGKCSCFTFKGQAEDVRLLMKWSDDFD